MCAAKQAMLNLRSRQLNPQHDDYWKSRGFYGRPNDWWERVYGNGRYEDADDVDTEYYTDGEYDDGDEYYDTDEYDDNSEYDDEDEYDDDNESEYDDENEYGDTDTETEEEELRLYSLQRNPNNVAYWQLRGYSYRPDNWYELAFGDDH